MYPYDENNDLTPDGESPGGSSGSDGSGGSEYRFVRPDAGKSWQDAQYTPQSEATVPPRYYVPEDKPAKEKREKKPGSGMFLKVACLCLCCALLGGAAGGAVTARLMGGGGEAETPTLSTADPSSTPAATVATNTGSGIYDIACQQVVGIKSEITTTNFFGMTSSGSVSGSGFVISEDGYIMTNYHVIQDAQQGGYDINVIFYDGTSYVASVVGFDSDNDVAVLKIDADGLTPASLGNSDSLTVGDTVFAVGNPLGELAYTMTSGIVSATDRVITTDESTSINMFQFDAAVNSGNSGGPVYNTFGQVVGVVTAKYSSTGVEGLGFAIPINDAVSIANDLMANGYVTGRAYMGLIPQTITESAAQYYNMPQGALVYSIEADACAYAAGVRQGDVIIELDGVAIASAEDLKVQVKSHAAGDSVSLKVSRSGEELTLTITFDEAKPDTAESSDGAQTQQPGEQQGGDQYPFGYSW